MSISEAPPVMHAGFKIIRENSVTPCKQNGKGEIFIAPPSPSIELGVRDARQLAALGNHQKEHRAQHTSQVKGHAPTKILTQPSWHHEQFHSD